MKRVYNLPRGAGKTTRMLYLSEYLQVPILCRSKTAKDCLIGRANEYGIMIPEPITPNDLSNKKFNFRNILVDESLEVLDVILNKYGLNVIGCTLTDEEKSESISVYDDPSFKDEVETLYLKNRDLRTTLNC